MQTKIYFNIEN